MLRGCVGTREGSKDTRNEVIRVKSELEKIS